MSTHRTRRALVISPAPVWPCHSGSSIVIASDILLLNALGYQVELLFFVPEGCRVDRVPSDHVAGYAAMDCAPGGAVKQVWRSMFTHRPSLWERWYAGDLRGQVLRWLNGKAFECALVQNSPVGGYLEEVKAVAGKSVFRVQNYTPELVRAIASSSGMPGSLWGRFELPKVEAFERGCMKRSDAVGVLCDRDADLIQLGYEVPRPQVAGFVLERPDLASLPISAGDPGVVVYLGRIDRRSAEGLKALIRGFSVLRMEAGATCELRIFGRQSVAVRMDGIAGVRFAGRVDSDLEALSSGRIFVNPQTNSGGVKLKSVCALLAGRALVSTPFGVEGLNLVPGIEYVHMECPSRLAEHVRPLLEDPAYARSVAENGREAGRRIVAKDRVVEELRRLVS